MARPTKEGLDYFPQWNPHLSTSGKFNNCNSQKVFKALRSSSSAFIKRSDVREFVFTRDKNKCLKCGTDKNLQVDHIISVKACIEGKISIEKLNQRENLQTLCGSCNAAKLP